MSCKISNLISALSSTLKTVGIQYKDAHGVAFGRVYTYKTDLELEVGEEVIVDAPSTGLTVVVVTEVHNLANIDSSASFAYKWVVAKVDVKSHAERLERQQELEKEFAIIQAKVEKMNKIKELKAALGYGENEECDELTALLAKINAQ